MQHDERARIGNQLAPRHGQRVRDGCGPRSIAALKRDADLRAQVPDFDNKTLGQAGVWCPRHQGHHRTIEVRHDVLKYPIALFDHQKQGEARGWVRGRHWPELMDFVIHDIERAVFHLLERFAHVQTHHAEHR